MHNKTTHKPGGDIDLQTLARLLKGDQPRAPGPTERRHAAGRTLQQVVAFLVASPSGTHPLRIGDQCAAIQRELKLGPHRDDYRFEPRWAVTFEEMIRHLNELDPTVIHFSGHGASGGVVLQDDRGNPEVLSARALAMMVEATAPNARLVMLDACTTTPHAGELRDKVDAVITMSGPITDEAARLFTTRFYGALGHRRSVGNAVAQGRVMLAAKQLPDEALPCCLTRIGLNADQLFLSGPDARVGGRGR